MTENNTQGRGQVGGAFATADCPSCGAFVSLAGSGRRGEQVRMTGTCPNGHAVFFNTVIP
ncbi:hypothetical protein SAMN04487818_108347 [Actinokineospora terrae]|uniref:Uncharacterized protein n=1 Tax=Actinokineospora terrae TaxID=155974 RepID=A0A1H9VG32_9PSEU|nr:hypothetical protein SAMN04487818_108347 [Actinokineospora terrae]